MTETTGNEKQARACLPAGRAKGESLMEKLKNLLKKKNNAVGVSDSCEVKKTTGGKEK